MTCPTPAQPFPAIDHRRTRRLDCRLPARLEWLGRTARVVAVNLSAGGALLELNGTEAPVPRTPVALVIAPGILRTHGGDVSVAGTVLRVDQTSGIRAGIEFTPAAAQQMQLLLA